MAEAEVAEAETETSHTATLNVCLQPAPTCKKQFPLHRLK